MRETRKAILTLQDGTTFEGKSFGAIKACAGEVVFTSSMTAYPECLSDPSTVGQILVSTYPIMGSYGMPPQTQTDGVCDFFESPDFHPLAVVCLDYSAEFNHWNAAGGLVPWLVDNGIVAVYGIDTRALAKHLRENGAMLGKIEIEGTEPAELSDSNQQNLIAATSCDKVIEYGKENSKRVVLVDCGVQHSMIRSLVSKGAHVIRVPWNYNFMGMDYDGIIVSNGPGDPRMATATVDILKEAIKQDKPVCGVGLGNLLVGMAAGATVVKLKNGHRGHNQPVREIGTDRCFITTQNHGYALDVTSLGCDWEPAYVSMNDGTNEGIRHKSKPFFATQFIPEQFGGEADSGFVYDKFLNSFNK